MSKAPFAPSSASSMSWTQQERFGQSQCRINTDAQTDDRFEQSQHDRVMESNGMHLRGQVSRGPQRHRWSNCTQSSRRRTPTARGQGQNGRHNIKTHARCSSCSTSSLTQQASTLAHIPNRSATRTTARYARASTRPSSRTDLGRSSLRAGRR